MLQCLESRVEWGARVCQWERRGGLECLWPGHLQSLVYARKNNFLPFLFPHNVEILEISGLGWFFSPWQGAHPFIGEEGSSAYQATDFSKPQTFCRISA